MARSKSVIMTAADKKALVAELKPQIAAAKAALKDATVAQKAELKAANAAIKAADKELVEITKLHTKAVALAEKTLAGLIAQNEELKAA